ncbi:molecular chaperone [Chitinibacter bivalviorum]|uniref:Molecular chaperone n=1 Tax=Chitinibacter bivalviorum TaxID=2739434 RepID=A0A7H9BM47_9NEIS|nr:fimbria/pilus periplasmic chaperone [Chitinibacter bivalviorum]QLG89476.1 molecular chaperone [Chitinibacter bivalviorum]
MRLTLAFILAAFCAASQAGQFAVSPIRVEFAAKDKSQAITVSNNGDTPLRIALELKRWTQDASGKEIYTNAPDELVYFPRQFEIAPKQKQIVRVGRKTAATDSEQAYRLYINEQPNTDEGKEGQVAMVVSFGVPVFMRPASNQLKLESSPLIVDKGQLQFTLSNRGNVTQRLTQVRIGESGGEIKQFEQWYLHPGVSRAYQLKLPASACAAGKPQKISIETDLQAISSDLLIPAAACKP